MKLNIDFFNCLFKEDFVSEYSHSNYIDDYEGKRYFHIDCSGLVYFYLSQMGHKRSLAELRSFLKQNNFIKLNRFFCKDFELVYNFSKDFHYWKFLKEPAVGCVMVIIFPDGNGHCVFIDEILKHQDDKLYLRIIDATRYPHKNDTRKSKTGIGFGEVCLIKDNNQWFYDAGNSYLGIRKANIYFVIPVK